ncbi:hypothetical protein N7456_001389 [Penicillium angulare]|uniref:Uncharacterized protein n=1 Tax=Penicillium angulare TaxID=116970 RepID=A0A9W9GDY0_9EURO|nr:hypothetical protein N7456_001389 [Penicillium angulare]
MSNFVHKVKDAIADHDKPLAPSKRSPNPGHRETNPFTSSYDVNHNAPRINHEEDANPGPNRPDPLADSGLTGSKKQTEYKEYPRGARTGTHDCQPVSDTRNPTSPSGDVSSSGRFDDMNSDPHQSKPANELDSHVNSAPEKRFNQASSGMQRENTADGGIDTNNTFAQELPSSQGVDNHISSEESYSKSTEQHQSHHQPRQFGPDGNQATGQNQEDSFSSSTQENKSHKATSHIRPCTFGAMKNDQVFDNSVAHPKFSGDSAGGSSYNQNADARESKERKDTEFPQKAGTGANLPTGQQNTGGDQRVCY